MRVGGEGGGYRDDPTVYGTGDKTCEKHPS